MKPERPAGPADGLDQAERIEQLSEREPDEYPDAIPFGEYSVAVYNLIQAKERLDAALYNNGSTLSVKQRVAEIHRVYWRIHRATLKLHAKDPGGVADVIRPVEDPRA